MGCSIVEYIILNDTCTWERDHFLFFCFLSIILWLLAAQCAPASWKCGAVRGAVVERVSVTMRSREQQPTALHHRVIFTLGTRRNRAHERFPAFLFFLFFSSLSCLVSARYQHPQDWIQTFFQDSEKPLKLDRCTASRGAHHIVTRLTWNETKLKINSPVKCVYAYGCRRVDQVDQLSIVLFWLSAHFRLAKGDNELSSIESMQWLD